MKTQKKRGTIAARSTTLGSRMPSKIEQTTQSPRRYEYNIP